MNKPIKMLPGIPYHPSYDFPDPSIEDIAQELINIYECHRDLEGNGHSSKCRMNCALDTIYNKHREND